MRERWRNTKDFPGYRVSDQGRVRSFRNGKPKIMTPQTQRLGYIYVPLTRDGKQHKGYIHRLMAKAFIPNPENLPEVNHINGRKDDNTLDNLEWCDRAGNMRHARETGLWDVERMAAISREVCRRPVYCYELDILFDRCADAADYFDVDRSTITMACRKKSHYAVGYHFCYEEDIDYLKRNIDKMRGLEKNYRPVRAINIHTGEERVYRSRRGAADEIGINDSWISNILAGRAYQTRGWTFEDIPIDLEERCSHE